jgi:multisubunit Na+/H+ antiporter MnhC subunit
MGFVETVVAVALGIALAPYVIPLLKKISNTTKNVVPVILGVSAMGYLVFTVIKGLGRFGGWLSPQIDPENRWADSPPEAVIGGAMVIGLLVGGYHGARKVLHHIRSQRKTLPHRETLLRIRILAVGAWLLFFAGESWWFRDISSWHIILPLALAYSVFGGIFLYKAGIL